MVTPGKHLGDLSACWPLVNVQNPLQLQRTHCFSVIWKSFAFAFSTTKSHTQITERRIYYLEIFQKIQQERTRKSGIKTTPSAHLAPKLQEILNFHTNQNHCNPWYTGIQCGIFFFLKLSVRRNTKEIKLTQSFMQNRNNIMHLFEGFCVNVHGVNPSPLGLFHKTQQ